LKLLPAFEGWSLAIEWNDAPTPIKIFEGEMEEIAVMRA
jgi:hypothetical protein